MAEKNWTQRSGTKDDFHDMLIDPVNPRRMIVTHDGGTMVSMTGGKTWSGTYTQRTTQTYRVHVDNQFPYNLYTNIQDLIGFKVPSASFWGGIPLSETEIYGSSEAGFCRSTSIRSKYGFISLMLYQWPVLGV